MTKQMNQKRKVLIVEDSITNQVLVATTLKKMGIASDIAQNGLEAVEAFKKQIYDLIVMDIKMPIMDGFEATEKIRAPEH